MRRPALKGPEGPSTGRTAEEGAVIVWLPKGTEPDDAGSWRDIVAHALGGLRPRRVELQRYGAKWRVRIAVQFDGAGAVPFVAGCAWADVTDEVAAALQSAGKPVFT